MREAAEQGCSAAGRHAAATEAAALAARGAARGAAAHARRAAAPHRRAGAPIGRARHQPSRPAQRDQARRAEPAPARGAASAGSARAVAGRQGADPPEAPNEEEVSRRAGRPSASCLPRQPRARMRRSSGARRRGGMPKAPDERSDSLRSPALDHFVLRVRDLDDSVAFYRDMLGLPIEMPGRVSRRHAAVRLGAGRRTADRPGARPDLRSGAAVCRPAASCTCACACEGASSATCCRACARHGVEVIEDAPMIRLGATGYGPSIYVRDPDGYVVELKEEDDRCIRPRSRACSCTAAACRSGWRLAVVAPLGAAPVSLVSLARRRRRRRARGTAPAAPGSGAVGGRARRRRSHRARSVRSTTASTRRGRATSGADPPDRPRVVRRGSRPGGEP